MVWLCVSPRAHVLLRKIILSTCSKCNSHKTDPVQTNGVLLSQHGCEAIDVKENTPPALLLVPARWVINPEEGGGGEGEVPSLAGVGALHHSCCPATLHPSALDMCSKLKMEKVLLVLKSSQPLIGYFPPVVTRLPLFSDSQNKTLCLPH